MKIDRIRWMKLLGMDGNYVRCCLWDEIATGCERLLQNLFVYLNNIVMGTH